MKLTIAILIINRVFTGLRYYQNQMKICQFHLVLKLKVKSTNSIKTRNSHNEEIRINLGQTYVFTDFIPLLYAT